QGVMMGDMEYLLFRLFTVGHIFDDGHKVLCPVVPPPHKQARRGHDANAVVWGMDGKFSAADALLRSERLLVVMNDLFSLFAREKIVPRPANQLITADSHEFLVCLLDENERLRLELLDYNRYGR